MSLLLDRWRVALTALLLLALPMQGYAVASMLACGMGAGQQAMHAAALDGAHHAGHDHHAELAHDRLHAADAASAGHGATDGPGDEPAHHSQSHDATCSACAACFVGAALPTADDGFAARADAQGFAAAPAFAVVTGAGDGLERPPRPARD